MTDTNGMTDDGKKVLEEAVAVVFGGIVAGLETGDPATEAEVIKELWPAMLDLSGYEIAKECVLRLAGLQKISNEVLADIALHSMSLVRPQ